LEAYERAFQVLRDANRSQVGVYLGFSNDLAHKIEAGADMFLMPSRFEPCGLNQMYSLKYGTVPIVRAAGGLDDTIENFDHSALRGNGFKFYEYDSERLLEKIQEALAVYAERDLWRALMLNGMRAIFVDRIGAALRRSLPTAGGCRGFGSGLEAQNLGGSDERVSE
jgi:starch synthase